MTLVHSTTKGLSAMVLALLHSRGLLDYDERVAAYWPEFAQAGKAGITVRQLLAHQAGLFAFDERVDVAVVADLDRLAGVMERQRPIWPPGERQAYRTITLGFYENELVRRIDPDHRTIGQMLHEDIADATGCRGRGLHRHAVFGARRAARRPGPARAVDPPDIDAAQDDDRRHTAPLGGAPFVDGQPGHRLLRRRRARDRARDRSALRWRGGNSPRHRHRLRGLRRLRRAPRPTHGDARGPRRTGDTGAARLLRRVFPWTGQVLARLHEAQ